MYIPKDINKCLNREAKSAGRINNDGLVVAPAWSKLFLQANYVIRKQFKKIELLRYQLEFEKMSRINAFDELERQDAEIERLRVALANYACDCGGKTPDGVQSCWKQDKCGKEARDALEGK